MSARTRLIRLLDRGFYPAELPPVFRTKNYSSTIGSFVPPQNYFGSTSFYDGATFKGHLRTFGIINPVSYFLLSSFIADKWKEITGCYRLSSSSGTRPKFPPLKTHGRAIQTAPLSAKRRSQQHLASCYPIILSLDINRFYGSIYTHSIPWAALGKDRAKTMLTRGTLGTHWSHTLDKITRNSNQRQTVGIAIGPDTSRIISELILSRIDAELCEKASGISSQQLYHNIDDYQIGVLDIGAAENAQSQFVRSLSRYELRLNDFKTSIDEGLQFAPSNFQRHFDVLTGAKGLKFVEHFFQLIYEQATQHNNSNVIGYALKRFAKPLARCGEAELVGEYLQRLIYAAPYHARWVLPLLLGTHNAGVLRSSKLINWGAEVCCRRNDVGSLLWFLYAAIFMKTRLNKSACTKCFSLSNPLVDLMLYHGRSLGLFSPSLRQLRHRYNGSDFKTSGWLTLYEVERRGWDTNAAFRKIGTGSDEGNLYDSLRNLDVDFYSADDTAFKLEAFDGWNLSDNSFKTGNDNLPGQLNAEDNDDNAAEELEDESY